MSELRKDPIVSRWVIISHERGKRPSDFPPIEEKKKNKHCPFCEGSESITPPEILAHRAGSQRDEPGWSLRVVPNKYPALRVEEPMDAQGEGLYDIMPGIGAHEVIIETPRHDQEITDLSDEHFYNVLNAYRDRILDLKKDMRLRYILIFKNRGSAAGATVEHTHSQLIATPVVPKAVSEEIEGSIQHYRLKERCIYCDIIHQELRDRKRVVFESDNYVAIEPFAARFPFETWILPKRHQSHFENESSGSLKSLSPTFLEVLRRLDAALDRPPYNYFLHTAPVNKFDQPESYHWHLEIVPKLTKVAGFEWGSGFFINPTPPEEAAEYLRQIRI